MPFSFICEEALPDVRGFSDCEPHFSFGEIDRVIIAPVTVGENFNINDHVGPDDWNNWTNWETLFPDEEGDIDEDNFYALQIPVRGSMGAPDRSEVEASKNRKAYPPAERTIEFRVDDIPDNVYTALGELDNMTVRMWFTSGQKIFGGPEGLVVQLKADPNIEEGRDSMHTYNCEAHYYGHAPERATITHDS